MERQQTIDGFSDVDRADDPAALVDYMDQRRGQEGIQLLERQIDAKLELQPGSTVLDVGCGTGDQLRALAEFVGRPAGQSGSIAARR